MEKTVFQREDGTMSFLRIPLCTAVGTRFRLKARKTERQVSCLFDWKDTCLFCILLMQLHGMKANGMGASERGMMPDVAGDASIQIKALQCSHGFVCHFAASSIIVCFAQLFPFGLTQTMEFQQVNFKEIIFLHKGNEFFRVFFAVIVAADGRLTQHQTTFPATLFQGADVVQNQFIAHICSGFVCLAVHVFYINKGKVDVLHDIQKFFSGEMRAGFNGSMDPQLLAALQDFYEEIMLGDGVAAAECDAAVAAPAAEIPAEDLQEFLAGVFPHTLFQRPVGADGCAGEVMAVLTLVPVNLRGLSRFHGDGACGTDGKTYVTAFVPFAGCLGEHQMFAVNPAFGVCAPTALQRTACHKYRGTAAGPVMDRKGLDIENMSHFIHRLTPVRLCSARSRKHHILHMSSFLFQSLCMC